MPAQKEILFSDLNYTFIEHPETGNPALVKNAESVKQAVKLLVLTNFHERFHHPFYGSNVKAQLFENVDHITASNISDEIKRVLRNFEPRADMLEIRVSPNLDYNGFSVKIVFRIVNIFDPITVNLFLERTR